MNKAIDELLVLETTSMRETLRSIDRNASGIAFVVDESRRLCGVVTDGDARRAIIKGLSPDSSVSEFMTSNPVTVPAGTAVEKVLPLLSERIKYVPVVDEQRRVVDYMAFAQFMHLPVASPAFPGNELRYVSECVITNWISSQGRFVSEFERLFAEFCAVKHAVALSNGTVALHLALVLAGVRPGDEVIVPTLSFAATANVVLHAGGTPVFVDSEPTSWNLDPEKVAEKITSKTKAIIPVHLYGHPADMDPLMDLARRHRLMVIEDAAEAHGATYKGSRVGSIGDIGCFSFFANKIVTTGEGGMLTTDDDGIADRARLLRAHGMSRSRKYWHEVVGYNYRLTNLQAAVGVAQMEQVDSFLKERKEIAEQYSACLSPDERIELQKEAPWAQRVNWLYTVLLREDIDRDAVIKKLEERGIDARPVFYPIHSMPPYAASGAFPVANSISKRGITLPTWIHIGEAQIRRICEALLDVLPR